MTRFAGALVVLLCGWLGACVSAGSDPGGGADSVTIAVSDTVYAPGDTAHVRVVNGSSRPVRFAFLCDAALEGNAGSELILFEPDCSMVRVRPTQLGPKEAMTVPLALHPLLPKNPQSYREFRVQLRFQYDDNDGYRFARSDAFYVRPH